MLGGSASISGVCTVRVPAHLLSGLLEGLYQEQGVGRPGESAAVENRLSSAARVGRIPICYGGADGINAPCYVCVILYYISISTLLYRPNTFGQVRLTPSNFVPFDRGPSLVCCPIVLLPLPDAPQVYPTCFFVPQDVQEDDAGSDSGTGAGASRRKHVACGVTIRPADIDALIGSDVVTRRK